MVVACKIFECVEKSFADSGAGFAVCLIATANPKISEAEIGIAKAKETVADGIIGVSGGSAMNLLCIFFNSFHLIVCTNWCIILISGCSDAV